MSAVWHECKFNDIIFYFQISFRSDKKFVTGNLDGSVSIFVDGQLKKTQKFEGKETLVQFINGEIVAASSDSEMEILNENLGIKKQFTAGTVTKNSTPWSLTGNEKYLASGNEDGVVRYYRRNGDAEPEEV